MAERFVVPLKPGNAGGGKGPQFQDNALELRTGRLVMNLTPPEKVRKLQEALQAKAKAAPNYRFYCLYDKVHRTDVLAFAYDCCRANKGAAGVDGQAFEDIEEYGRERWLGELTQALKGKTYRPAAVRRVSIPKPDGKQRPSGIPTVKDRVAQAAALLVLGPVFETAPVGAFGTDTTSGRGVPSAV